MANNVDYKSLVGYKSFDELRLTAFNRLKELKSKITNLNIGGIFRTLLELAMQGLADLYALLPDIVKKGYLMNAKGVWLDLKAEELGLFRKEALKAEGFVIFGRADASGNKTVPAGTIVKTDTTPSGEELRYFITADMICNAGMSEIAVPAIAEFSGTKYNVGEGVIKNTVTHVQGFDYVRNASNWLSKEGSDLEDDDLLLQRCQLRWNELALGGTRMAYESWALGVAGVVGVLVEDNAPRGNGTVDVIILSTSGMPTAELINSVQTVINGKKPLCANVLVKAPVAQTIDLALTVYLQMDSTLNPDIVQSVVRQTICAYFGQGVAADVKRLGIGQDFILFQLESIIKKCYNDIYNILFALPASDIIIEAHKIAALGTLTIDVERMTGE